MKSIFFKAITVLVILATITMLASCKKESAGTVNEFAAQYNQAFAEEVYNDADNILEEAEQGGSVTYKAEDESALLAGCAVVTRDTLSLPRLTTIDFGSGCTGPDGRTRKGKILVTHDGPYHVSGTTSTITFDNYFVNDNEVLGTKTIRNEGLNANGNLYFTVTVSGQILFDNNGGTLTWTANRVREWIAGANTQPCNDDVYSITGSSTGTNTEGSAVTQTIITPLIRNLAHECRRHFVSGSVLHQCSGKPDRTIDFGNGACDDEAVVTANGHTHTIHLHP